MSSRIKRTLLDALMPLPAFGRKEVDSGVE